MFIKFLIKQYYRTVINNKLYNRLFILTNAHRYFSIKNVMNCRMEPNLKYFIQQETKTLNNPFIMNWENEPFIDSESLIASKNDKVYIKTYGCQMNINDTEIAISILEKFGYEITNNPEKATIILLMTCAIRENAENKVWNKLLELEKAKQDGQIKQFGLLGCMAERLKTKVIEKIPLIDIIAGPDSYRHLPKLLAINRLTGQSAVNVLLSIDETYSDVIPKTSSEISAYVSITRGCNNMCSYCIVPYTRGQERSRAVDSILEEVQNKINNGIKEIILLGQNVNSYRDFSPNNNDNNNAIKLADGFKTIYKPKSGGIGFDLLLEQVALIDPNVRIRFTSPHPKDFNDDVLAVIAKHKNIAKGLHLPVQSGSNEILERMRRGYTRESYLNLVKKIENIIPNCGLSSDFICGFCGETEAHHQETLDLFDKVNYYIAYIFAYSMRKKTHAYHHLKDDVPKETKIRRLIELNEIYRQRSLKMNQELIGREQLILIEGISKKSDENLYGRNEANQKVIIPKCSAEISPQCSYSIGDFLRVQIVDCTSVTLMGKPISTTTIADFYS